MSRRVRWECPRCGGAVLGSTRPRRDATVRYCLECSADEGRLIERTAPALDRQRFRRTEVRKERERRQRSREERELTERHTVLLQDGPLDLREPFAELAALGRIRNGAKRVWGGAPPKPVLKSVRRVPGRGRDYASGSCNGDWISVTIRGVPDRTEVEVLILHELVHYACPAGETHGWRFRSLFKNAARDAWGIRLEEPPGTARALHYALVGALRESRLAA